MESVHGYLGLVALKFPQLYVGTSGSGVFWGVTRSLKFDAACHLMNSNASEIILHWNATIKHSPLPPKSFDRLLVADGLRFG